MAYEREKTVTVKVTSKDFIKKTTEAYGEFKGDYGGNYLFMCNREIENNDADPRGYDHVFNWVTADNAGYSDKIPGSGIRYKLDDFKDPQTGRRYDLDFAMSNIIFPLCLHRHSGDHVFTKDNFEGLNDFDSGVMGFAFADGENIKKLGLQEWNGDDIKRKFKEILQKEIDMVNAVNDGYVYDFIVFDLDKEEEIECLWDVIVTCDGDRRDESLYLLSNFVKDREVNEKFLESVYGADERKVRSLSCYKHSDKDKITEPHEYVCFYKGKDYFNDGELNHGLVKYKLKEEKDGSPVFVLKKENELTSTMGHYDYFYFKSDFSEKSACEFLRQYDKKLREERKIKENERIEEMVSRKYGR